MLQNTINVQKFSWLCRITRSGVWVVLEYIEQWNCKLLEALRIVVATTCPWLLRWVVVACMCISSVAVQAGEGYPEKADALRLGTFGFSSDRLKKAKGPMTDRMRKLAQRVGCAVEQQGLTLTVVHGALKRIKRKVKSNDIDGFLFALRSAERDEFMVPLAPAFSSGISLYWLKGRLEEPLVKSNLRIAHLKGAAYRLSEYQLEDQVVAYANEPRGLAGLLLRGRVDAVLGTDQGFGGILDGLGVEYGQEQVDNMTFYIQLSKRYLSQHPEFAPVFVSAMAACDKAAE